ncbi:MAG: tetratricopeptide repeat protein, partial [Chromatiales bacterium]|nr:tetratricopeptide repeat protein [Chromatiales bacterium]
LRANALSGLKRSDEAERLYRALIKESPQDPTPYNNLATLYAASGRLQEASELLTQAIKSDQRYAAIYKNLSSVYVEMSRNSYARALSVDEPRPGMQLQALDHQAGPTTPIQVAVVEKPREVVPPPAKPVVTSPSRAADRPVTPTPAPVVTTARVESPPSRSQPNSQPVTQTVGDDFDAGGAIAALRGWAAAWSAKDVDGYLAAYDSEFLPPRDMTRDQWEAERRLRLKRPREIEVRLSDFEVSSTGGDSLTVKLLQRYRSDSYRDATRKGFILVQRNGQWKIGDEYTIEVIK